MKSDKIKIEELIGDNIFSYEDIYLDFSKYRNSITIFLGLNLDMGEDANAAGKSNILRMIHYGFYGKDKRATLDDMIHQNNPEKGFALQLSFSSSDDNKIYKITRFYRYSNKHSKIKLHDGSVPKGSGIEFVIDGHRFFIEKDNKAIQSMIQKTIGISSTIFLSSVLTEQRKYKTFLDETDSDKKEFLSKLLDLTEYDDAYEYTKKFVLTLESIIKELCEKKEKYENTIKDHKKSISLIKENKIKQNKEKELKIANIKEKIVTAERLHKSILDEIKKDSTRNSETAITQLQEELKKLKSRKAKINEIQESISLNKTIEEKISINLSKIELISKQKEAISLEIESLNGKLHSLNSEFLSISASDENIKELEKTLTDLSTNIKKISDIELKKQSVIISLSKLDSRKNELTEQNKKIEDSIKHTNTKKECPECHSILKEDDQKFVDLIKKNKNKIDENLIEISRTDSEIKKGTDWVEHSLKYISQKEILQKKYDSAMSNKNSIQKDIDKKNGIKKEINYYTTDLLKKQTSLSDISRQTNLLENEIDSLKLKIIKIQESFSTEELKDIDNQIIDKINTINSIESSIKVQKEKLIRKTQSENQIKDFNDQLKELQFSSDDSSVLLEHHESEIATYETAVSSTSDEIEKRMDELKYYNFWRKGFSPTGIKSFITEDVINMINVKGNEFLHFISNGALSIKLEPQVESDKGVVSNKISTKFFEGSSLINDGLISGGQYQRFILAIDLAISAIVEEKCKSKFDIKFIDEHFDGISTKGQKMALKLFSKQAKERSGFFIISHDKELQQFCDNAIYIIKENKVSKIVDRETFLKKGQSIPQKTI